MATDEPVGVPASTPNATGAVPAPVPAAPPQEESLEEVTKEMTEELQEILAQSGPIPTAQADAVNVLPQAAAVTPEVAPVVPAEAVPVTIPPASPMPAPEPVPPAPAEAAPTVAPATVLPPIPVAADGGDHAHHQVMGQILGTAIEAGKHEVPQIPAKLVCRPRTLESWRVFKIMSEFVEGFELIGKYGLAASFFGTARASFESRYYAEAEELAGKLAKEGYAVITGGSAGIMQAANEGAFDAGGASIGLNIELDDNQGLNKFLTESMTFDHFFARKVMLAYASDVYIYFPGGYGTLDEFTEVVTLIQTKKIRKIPIVLYGAEYWTPLIEFFKNKLFAQYHAIDESDLDLFVLCDSVDDAFAYIQANVTSC